MDVTPPSITCPATLNLLCNAPVPASDITLVTATDACGTPTVTFVSDAANTVGCIETTTRTYRAVDACGNTAVCTQSIIRTVDVTPPSITCPATLTLLCNAPVPAPDIPWLLQPMPVVLQLLLLLVMLPILLVVSRPLQELTVRLMLAVTLLYVLRPL